MNIMLVAGLFAISRLGGSDTSRQKVPFYQIGADAGGADPNRRTVSAILAYIVYRATNLARHQSGVTSETAEQIMGQLLHDSVRNHGPAPSVVECIFITMARLN